MENTLFGKLVEIQSRLVAPKGQFNAFGKYKYRSCEDVLEALKPLLAEQDVTLIITDEIVLVGDRHYVKALATISDGTNSISATAFAREPKERKGMDDAQVTGATSSYARKYALNGLFCIDDNKDADSNGQHEQPKEEVKTEQPTPTNGKFISEKQGKRLIAIALQNGHTKELVKDYVLTMHKIDRLANIPTSLYESIVSHFQVGAKNEEPEGWEENG